MSGTHTLVTAVGDSAVGVCRRNIGSVSIRGGHESQNEVDGGKGCKDTSSRAPLNSSRKSQPTSRVRNSTPTNGK